MRKSLFKKISATVLSLTLVVGMTAAVPAAVKKGTDISNGVKWSSYSIHANNSEDKGAWEKKLKNAGQFYNTNVTKESGLDAAKTYGENGKITTQTSSSFLMDIVSTGWSATWIMDRKTGEFKPANNPWGVTATKILKVDKGRTYTASFKIKSTLKNDITKSETRSDGTMYNVSTGKINTVKHVHIKAYKNNELDHDPALSGVKMTATYKGKNVLSTTKADLLGDKYNVIALDSKDDDFTDVTITFTIPGDKLTYGQSTMGIKFAFGALLGSFEDENNMSGTIEVKDFKVVAGDAVPASNKVSKVKTNAKKGTMKVSLKKAKGAKQYEVQYYTSYNKSEKKYSGKKTVKIKKATVTIKNKKKIKAKKTLYVRTRYYKMVNGKKMYSVWSAMKKVKVK